MPRRAPHQKSTFSYFLPFLILILIVGGGFFGFRYYLENYSRPAVIEDTRPVAILSIDSGNVDIKFVDKNGWNRATEGMTLYTGDSIRTMSDSVASITFFDNSVARLDKNSELIIENMQIDDSSDIVSIYLDRGNLWAQVTKMVDENSRFEVETPTSLATARGTAFEVIVTRQIIINEETGESEEIVETRVRVIENQVGFRAIEQTITEDEQGNTRTETRVLASVILPTGSESSIDSLDIIDFSEEPGQKPVVRSISPEDRQGEWHEFNMAADQAHLEKALEELRAQLEEVEYQNFLEKFFQSAAQKSKNEKAKATFYQIQAQLSQIDASLRQSEADSTNKESEENTDSEDNDDAPEGEGGDDDQPTASIDRTHIVQPGDTLSAIANRYGISITALMQANGITNPDSLQIDQELKIPSGDDVKIKPVVKPAVRPYYQPLTDDDGGEDGDESDEDPDNENTQVKDNEPFESAQ